MGAEGVEQFVSTPEQHSDEAIETDPLPPGQVWASAGTGDKKNAEIHFREAVKKGLVNSNRVVQDVLLRTVFSAKEIKDLLEKSGR